MTQLELFPITEPDYESDDIEERFWAFHEANPHVADALEQLATEWLSRRQRVGMKALYERLRWESGIRTDGDPYRLNNNYTAFYARLLLARHPEWTDRIQTRQQKAVKTPAAVLRGVVVNAFVTAVLCTATFAAAFFVAGGGAASAHF